MEVGEWSISSPASKFLLGAPWSEKLAHGWVHPLRISPNSLESLALALPGTPVFLNRW